MKPCWIYREAEAAETRRNKLRRCLLGKKEQRVRVIYSSHGPQRYAVDIEGRLMSFGLYYLRLSCADEITMTIPLHRVRGVYSD